jgi:hypothetical protein
MHGSQATINSFGVYIDIPVQLKCRTSMHYNQTGNHNWVLFNFDHGMCSIGNTHSYDGGLTYTWNAATVSALRESKDGLQYFDQGSNGWKFFEDDVQAEYAGYKLEKELK